MAGASKFTPGPWRVYNGDVVGANNVMLGSAADLNLIAAAPEGYALAQFIKAHATQETLSTHVAVSFSEADAAMILNLAERFLSKAEGASQ